MDGKSITDWVTGIGTAVTAAATVVLFVVALVQLRGLREQITQAAGQERRRNTLEVIDRAESDPPYQSRKCKPVAGLKPRNGLHEVDRGKQIRRYQAFELSRKCDNRDFSKYLRGTDGQGLPTRNRKKSS